MVFRSLNQARKVVNALIREYGSPVAVHIELGRDLSKSFEDRMEIRKGQKLYAEEKQSAVNLFKETFDGREPSSRNQDLLKFRLYREQDCQCAYSQKPLEIERLLEVGYVEIDHVLPYSRSFDDSQNNKVLVLAKENREKGNRTPFEYLDGASNSERWRRFEAWVRGHKGLRRAKRERLLRKAFDEREAREFAERNLNDTRYATRYFSNFVRQNLRFAEGAGDQPVLTPSGAFTSFLRARWGLIKNREQSDLHHALDAAVVAAASHALVKRVSDFHRRDELVQLPNGTFADRVTGEILSAEATAALGLHFPKPWENFHEELMARLAPDGTTYEDKNGVRHEYDFANYTQEERAKVKPIWISRAPKRRNGGALHQETIRSAKLLDKGLSYANVKLQDLKLADLDDIVGAYRLDEDGKPVLGADGKPLPDPRNAALIEILRLRLSAHGGDGKKAFADPVYKPSAPGKKAPLVRTVKLLSTQKGGVRVRGGIADQASMWRVDVFEKAGKFYLVPIYQSDRRKGAQLPNRAVTLGKNREEWELIEDDAFKFSVCLNDPVTLRQRKDAFTGYFAGLDISTAAIHIWAHDRNLTIGKDGLYRSLGVKTAHGFEKYHVDVLGHLYSARLEKRRGLA